jgi:transcriptional regulator
MYAPPFFQIDRAASLQLAATRGFGVIIASGNSADAPVASPVPYCIGYAADGSPRVQLHVARQNPLAEIANAGGTWLLSVMAEDTYVSPDWYASEAQVPTWLYQNVQLSGPVRVMMAAELDQHLVDLSEKFEAWLLPKPPWKVDKVPAARHKQLTRAIVGIEMTVETVIGTTKHNQHKTDADHVAIANALKQQPGDAPRAIATSMVAARPHLAYE